MKEVLKKMLNIILDIVAVIITVTVSIVLGSLLIITVSWMAMETYKMVGLIAILKVIGTIIIILIIYWAYGRIEDIGFRHRIRKIRKERK